VFHPDGSPAAGVEVILCTLEKGAVLGQGRFLDHSDSILTHADDRGRFQFPVVHAPHTVVAVSHRGFGRASVQASNQAEIRLEPFGAIEGRLLRDGQPLPGRGVLLLDQSYAHYRGAVSLDVAAFSAKTDATGAFRIEGVPAGDFLLYQNPGVGQPFTGQTVASVLAGQLTTIVMGQLDPTGRTVVGQLKPSEPILGDWRRMVSMSSFTRKLPRPEPPKDLTEEARQLWRVAWHQSEAGGAWLRQWSRHDVEVAADGRFIIRGVPPDEYEFWLDALPEETPRTDPWREQNAPWRGHASPGTVIVPPTEPGSPDAPYDLGDVTLKIQHRKR
jgi:hypothetical protein